MGYYLAGGELLVIETEDDHYLGTAEVHEALLIVRSGYVGRPVLLDLENVQSVIPADEHPLVEQDNADADVSQPAHVLWAET